MTTKIKTCGMFRAEDIVAVNEVRPDFVGFVVNFPKSHRSITPQQALEFRTQLSEDIQAVGVFVDEDPETVAQLVNDGGIDIAQLHGHEYEAYIAHLRSLCNAPIFQAFKVRSADDVARALASSADMILLDNGYGTGECFDWSVVGQIDRPFILAGGLTPENIPEAIEQLHPWAVDLSSSLETDKVKDAAKIAKAVAAVRKGN